MARPWGETGAPLEGVGGDSRRPTTPTTAERAKFEPQHSMQDSDDPMAVVEAAETRELSEFQAQTASLPAAVRPVATMVGEILSEAAQRARGLAFRLERIADDDTLPLDARARLWEEAIESRDGRRPGLRMVEGLLDRGVANAIDILETTLAATALPKLEAGREAFSREELRIRLDGPRPLETADMILSGPNRQLAATLLAGMGHGEEEGSGLLEAYLSRIPDTRDRVARRRGFLMTALRGSLNYGSEVERAAAAAIITEAGAVNQARKAAAPVRYAVARRLQAVRERAPQ